VEGEIPTVVTFPCTRGIDPEESKGGITMTDFTPPGPYTFYSDGNHATTAGTNPLLVSIRDSFFGTIGPTVPFT
jgi:hypothetical protein